MEREASELPKSLVLGRDENIHIRLTRSTPLGDVGSYNPPHLGARHPRWHTSGQELAMIPNYHIPARTPTTSRARFCRNTILSALGPDHASRFCFWNSREQNFQWVTHHGNALAHSRLTLEFLRNPKPVSSQKASC